MDKGNTTYIQLVISMNGGASRNCDFTGKVSHDILIYFIGVI